MEENCDIESSDLYSLLSSVIAVPIQILFNYKATDRYIERGGELCNSFSGSWSFKY